MKKSVSLSLFQASETAPVLFMGDIERNIPLIKDMGYDGVDLFVLEPEAEVSKQALRVLKKNGLGVGVVMPAALAGEGLFLGHKDPEIRETIVPRMIEIMQYASEVGGMVSLGLVRGSVEGDDTVDALLDRFTDTVGKLMPASKKYGVDLVVEPINRYEINTLCSSIEAYEYIEKSGLDLYLMLDTFHMNIEDVSIEASLRTCADRIRHIHFLDSNRLAPGMGHLDMKGIYGILQDIGYDGYLCLEALAKPTTEICASKGMEFFNSIGLV